jgi:hypothetical protein
LIAAKIIQLGGGHYDISTVAGQFIKGIETASAEYDLQALGLQGLPERCIRTSRVFYVQNLDFRHVLLPYQYHQYCTTSTSAKRTESKACKAGQEAGSSAMIRGLPDLGRRCLTGLVKGHIISP